MTRQQIEKDYTVENGIICSPGKFEGCAVYMPYFWSLYLDGATDDDYDYEHEILISTIRVDEVARSIFPELGDRQLISFFETDQGFVVEL